MLRRSVMTLINRSSKLLILACLLVSCQIGPSVSANDAADAASRDVAVADTSDSSVPDEDGADRALDSGIVDADTGDSSPYDFDPELWQQPNPCDGTVSYPGVSRDFQMPSRETDEEPIVTRDELIADFIDVFGVYPEQGLSVRVAENLQPGPDRHFDLYASPGTDATFHLYMINSYPMEELQESFRLGVTVMVDYEPVEATYVRWNPDRTQKWLEMTTTGINVPIRSDVEIVDVTIPGEVFSERRAYEIEIALNTLTIERSPRGGPYRFILYNGAYDRPSRPCSEPRLNEPSLELEDQLFLRVGARMGLLFPEDISDKDELRQVLPAEPGETKRLFLSVMRSSVRNGPKPTVLAPVIDGEPTGQLWWVTQGSQNRTDAFTWIDARKSFEVTLPEEPGIHEVQVLMWNDPYELWRDLNGQLHRDVDANVAARNSSNALRFEVKPAE